MRDCHWLSCLRVAYFTAGHARDRPGSLNVSVQSQPPRTRPEVDHEMLTPHDGRLKLQLLASLIKALERWVRALSRLPSM